MAYAKLSKRNSAQLPILVGGETRITQSPRTKRRGTLRFCVRYTSSPVSSSSSNIVWVSSTCIKQRIGSEMTCTNGYAEWLWKLTSPSTKFMCMSKACNLPRSSRSFRSLTYTCSSSDKRIRSKGSTTVPASPSCIYATHGELHSESQQILMKSREHVLVMIRRQPLALDLI